MQRKSCRELRALLESFSDDLIMTSTDGFVGWSALLSPLCRHAVESVKASPVQYQLQALGMDAVWQARWQPPRQPPTRPLYSSLPSASTTWPGAWPGLIIVELRSLEDGSQNIVILPCPIQQRQEERHTLLLLLSLNRLTLLLSSLYPLTWSSTQFHPRAPSCPM